MKIIKQLAAIAALIAAIFSPLAAQDYTPIPPDTHVYIGDTFVPTAETVDFVPVNATQAVLFWNGYYDANKQIAAVGPNDPYHNHASLTLAADRNYLTGCMFTDQQNLAIFFYFYGRAYRYALESQATP